MSKNGSKDEQGIIFLACIIGLLIGSIVGIAADSMFLGIILSLALIFGICYLGLNWDIIKSKYQKRKKEKRQGCINFVNIVNTRNLGITEDNYKKRRRDLELINKNYHCLKHMDNVVRAYSLGLKYREENIKKNKETEIKATKQREKDKHDAYIKKLVDIRNNQEKVASLEGKEKYLVLLKARLKEMNKKKAELEEAKKKMNQLAGIIAVSTTPTTTIPQEPGLDWKTSALAGAASAVGGPMAGMMVISDSMTQQLNNVKTPTTNINPEEAEKFRNDFMSHLTPAMQETDKKLSELNNPEQLKYEINSFDLLIDTGYLAEKAKNITPNVMGYKVITPYEMYVDVKFSTKEVEVLNEPAIIDGSFRVNVYDVNKLVARGVVSGEGYGVTDIEGIGFRNNTFRLLCYSADGIINQEHELRIEVEPQNLWYVENRKYK